MITLFRYLMLTILMSNLFESNATNTKDFLDIRSIVVTSDEGKIHFDKGGSNAATQLTHDFKGPAGRITTEVKDGTLYVTNDKKMGGGNCDFTFTMPKETSIMVNLEAGHVNVADLGADARINIGAGNITIKSSEIPSKPIRLHLIAGAGIIQVSIPQDAQVKYYTKPTVGYGQMNLLTESPRGDHHYLIKASTGAGDITVQNENN